MPFKDRDRQRAYQRDWVRRRRLQGSTKGSTEQGSTTVRPKPVVMSRAEWAVRNISNSRIVPLTKERQVAGFNKR